MLDFTVVIASSHDSILINGNKPLQVVQERLVSYKQEDTQNAGLITKGTSLMEGPFCNHDSFIYSAQAPDAPQDHFLYPAPQNVGSLSRNRQT
ncbi:hypothetical protein D3C76_1716120 [compost metagenome]